MNNSVRKSGEEVWMDWRLGESDLSEAALQNLNLGLQPPFQEPCWTFE